MKLTAVVVLVETDSIPAMLNTEVGASVNRHVCRVIVLGTIVL